MRTTPNPKPKGHDMNDKIYLVYTEVHDMYGIGRDLVKRLVAEKRLHRVKVGTAFRYNRAELDNIFSGGRIRRHVRASRRATA